MNKYRIKRGVENDFVVETADREFDAAPVRKNVSPTGERSSTKPIFITRYWRDWAIPSRPYAGTIEFKVELRCA
jgi:hypothetical protein